MSAPWAGASFLPFNRPVPQAVSPPSTRLRFLDAARGTAMLFVLLSHFGAVFFRSSARSLWAVAFTRVGMIASPAFILISGVLLGVLYKASGPRFRSFRIKAIDRGLLLLLV